VLANLGSGAGAGNGNTIGSGAGVQDWRNLAAEYGPPDWDRRNVFTTAIVYDLPFFKSSGRLLRSALGDWTFAGKAVLESGFALSPGMSYPTGDLHHGRMRSAMKRRLESSQSGSIR